MDRRQFLTMGAGALAARVFGLDLYRTGIEDETVLKVSTVEIDVGALQPFRVFHFSDTHLNFFDVEDYGAVDATAQARLGRRWCRFPQALNSFYASVEYARARRLPMLHTGDLVDFVSDGNLRFLRNNASIVKDIFYVPGNHEYQMRTPQKYTEHAALVRDRLAPCFGNGIVVATKVIGGVKFVTFDNAINGTGNVSPLAISMVKREFDGKTPVVLACHIPPEYPLEFREKGVETRRRIGIANGEDPKSLENLPIPPDPTPSRDEPTRAFYSWLKTREELKAILCGHTHIEERAPFSETADIVVTAGNFDGHAHEIVFR